jgi:hypothetical protein
MRVDDAGRIVIIGGGHAGGQLCAALAAEGLGPRVHLVCEEPELPYQRPPLSKTYLKNPQETVQLHRPEPWYAEAGITLYRADPTAAIERSRRMVRLRSGRELGYSRLVFATGARARGLPHLPDGLSNVAVLRTAADAERLRQQLAGTQRLTVLGGGFIGLEVAATARLLGKEVTVLEAAPRLLMRSASQELAAHVLHAHRSRSASTFGSAWRWGAFFAMPGGLRLCRWTGKRRQSGYCCWALAPNPSISWRAMPDCTATTASWWTNACALRMRPYSLSGTAAIFHRQRAGGGCESSRFKTPTTRRAPRSPRLPTARSLIARCPGSGPSKAPCGCRWPACCRPTDAFSARRCD